MQSVSQSVSGWTDGCKSENQSAKLNSYLKQPRTSRSLQNRQHTSPSNLKSICEQTHFLHLKSFSQTQNKGLAPPPDSAGPWQQRWSSQVESEWREGAVLATARRESDNKIVIFWWFQGGYVLKKRINTHTSAGRWCDAGVCVWTQPHKHHTLHPLCFICVCVCVCVCVFGQTHTLRPASYVCHRWGISIPSDRARTCLTHTHTHTHTQHTAAEVCLYVINY